MPVEQARFFRQIVRNYPANHFRPTDVPVLEEYVRLKFKLDQLWAKMQAKDFEDTVVTDRGGEKTNPIYNVWSATHTNFQKYARLCRLTPNSRSATVHQGVADVDEDEDDPFELRAAV